MLPKHLQYQRGGLGEGGADFGPALRGEARLPIARAAPAHPTHNILTHNTHTHRRAQSCIKKIDPEDIEIDIDAIDPTTFWTVDAFIKDCLPGGKKFKKAKGGAGGAASAGAAGAVSSSDPKAKKPKVA